MTNWQCPFCGGNGKSTDEHVWAKWLRRTRGAQQLLSGHTGKRMPLEWPSMYLSDDGRYTSTRERQRDWAELLPHVTVKVCKDCNTGWMSQLETQAKEIVGPLLFGGQRVWLGPEEQLRMARWATKSFMAYALTLGPLDNPFSLSDYRTLAVGREVPNRIWIWMAHVESRLAQVGTAIRPSVLSKDFDPVNDQNNTAVGFLAAGGLVFMLLVLPDALAELAGPLAPPRSAENRAVHLLSRPTGIAAVRSPDLGEDYMEEVVAWLDCLRVVAMPAAEGLSPEELAGLQQMFLDGVTPLAMRSTRPVHLGTDFRERAVDHERKAIEEARGFIESGDFKGAALLLTHRGREHFNQGDYEGASRLLIAAIDSPGSGLKDDAEAAYRVGQCYWNLQSPEAEEWYQRAIVLGLDSPQPRFGIVDARARSGDYAGALEMLRLIAPETIRDQAVLAMAIPAFEFVVDELGVREQRGPMAEVIAHEGDVSPQDALDLIAATGVLRRDLWRLTSVDDDRVSFHFARAWFGDEPLSWLGATLALSEYEAEALVEAVVRLGLDRIPEFVYMVNPLLEAFSAVGMEDHPGAVTLRALLSRLTGVPGSDGGDSKRL